MKKIPKKILSNKIFIIILFYNQFVSQIHFSITYVFLTSQIFLKLNFQKNETGIKTKYAQNPRSMQQSEYLSVFFVCQKPIMLEDDEYHNGNDKPNDLNGHGHH